jgi:hypothetical protein
MALDTQVMLLRPDRGLIGGFAIVWGKTVHGTVNDQPHKWQCVKSTDYVWPSDVPLLWNHDPAQDIGEVITKSIWINDLGVYVFATLRDVPLLIKARQGLLYYSPCLYPLGTATKVQGGLIDEITLTDSPGTPITDRHLTENAYTYQRIDAIMAELESIADGPESIGLLPEEVVLSALSMFLGPQTPDEMSQLRRAGIGA